MDSEGLLKLDSEKILMTVVLLDKLDSEKLQKLDSKKLVMFLMSKTSQMSSGGRFPKKFQKKLFSHSDLF